MHDQRNYQRITFRTEADIIVAGTPRRCDLVDLALQGALFRCEKELALDIGERAGLRIFLPDSSVEMDFSGELIHQRNQFYGFIFSSADDQSMSHLRRLLELNFGDGNQADEEFSQWLNQKKTQAP